MAQTIYPQDRQEAADLARRLLDAAGPDRHDEIRTVTDGAFGIAFDVPDDVYTTVSADVGAAADGEAGEAPGGGERSEDEPLPPGAGHRTEPPGKPASDRELSAKAGDVDTAVAPAVSMRPRRRGAESERSQGRK